MGEETWFDYIFNRPKAVHKVLIKKDSIDYIFSVVTNKIDFQGKNYKTAIFTDISQSELIQNTLEESETYNRMIFEESSRAIVIYDPLKNGFIDCNDAAVKAYGYSSKKEVLGKTPLDVSAPTQYDGRDSSIASQEQDLSALSQGAVSFEWIHQRPNGELWDANVHLMQFNYKNKILLQFTLDDITEQNKSKKIIDESHKRITDSINYASLIQNALIPAQKKFNIFFDDCFILWNPKDVVGGDIYLFEELENKKQCILMVIDCTGHGVPGAFVTILVKAIERQIISDINHSTNKDISPARILKEFNKSIKYLLNQQNSKSISNAGFDGAIICYNKEEKILKFSGAETPLFYTQDDILHSIKGDRQSVGYKKSNIDFEFTDHTIKVKEGMKFYLTTDGYMDQNGGEKGFPLGKNKLIKTINEVKDMTFQKQKEMFIEKLKTYQGNEERNDDITFIGFKI